MNRRTFVRRLAAAAAAAAVPPSPRPTLLRGKAPSRLVTLGFVGAGGMGTNSVRKLLPNPDVRILAVCDVDAGHAAGAKRLVDAAYGDRGCATFNDFRDLLARKDIDAVVISVPDHWHAVAAVAAARAGKDIYGEKPLARSIREGRLICEAVRNCGRVWQTGSIQRSNQRFRFACELVRNGRIGRVHKVEVGLPEGKSMGPAEPMPVPEGLDWDRWLGPAPWAPYTEMRCHYNWRHILDYSGGKLTDWAGHHVDIAHWGLGLEHTGPVMVRGTGDYPGDGLWNAPVRYLIECTYVDGTVLHIGDTTHFPMGVKWYGEGGWIHADRGSLEAEPRSLLHEVIGPDEIRLYASDDHYQNFIDCVKSRQTAVAPPDVAHRSISVALLGEIAMLTGRTIRWNPDTEEIVGDPGASTLLGRTWREPWAAREFG